MVGIEADDGRFAEFLRATVPELDVHMPPVPKEEMWTRIVAQRHGHALLDFAPATEGSEDHVAAPVAPASIGGRPPRWHRRGIPVSWAVPLVAAVLVMGVVVGAQIGRQRAERHRAAVAAAIPASQAIQQIPPGLPAQLATQRHLREVRRLLNTFAVANRNNQATPQVDAHMAAWARNLLATTQLLLDSPAGMDPQRRQLLTDIEMVLVQITQLAPDALPQDRGFVQQSLQHSDVLKRLQDAVPSGVPGGI